MGISVVLSHPHNWQFVSWGIMKATGSDVSHASIRFFDASGSLGGGTWHLEAVAHGLILKPLAKWEEHNDARYVFSLKSDLDATVGYPALMRAFPELGDEYDYDGIVRFALYLLTNKVSHALAERFIKSTPDKMFCSEAVFRVLQIMSILADGDGFEPLAGMQPEIVSPEDLKILRRCGAFEVTYANPST